jgi:SAM-dependent methyltransferase
MVGKMILPKLGGTPFVWNTCMVFFQMILLLGYTYAHLTIRAIGIRRQLLVHIVVALLPLAVLPICFGDEAYTPSGQNPSVWLLGQLAFVVGLPFFVVSTSAPLLQKWFAYAGHATSKDPYFMYSASNAGSLIALLSYPFLIEPNVGLTSQTQLWSACYILFVILVTCCAFSIWRAFKATGCTLPLVEYGRTQQLKPLDCEDQSQPPVEVTNRQRIKWFALAFVPSSLMLGITTHITIDITPAPLLWVIPLALYLLSFVIVFARKPVISYNLMTKVMIYAVLVIPLFFAPSKQPLLQIPIHLTTFFVVCMVCHGALARSRPRTKHLTDFYLWISLGGVCGGAFNSFVAPLLFDSVAEYPVMLVASCFLRPSNTGTQQWAFSRRDCLWLTVLSVLVVGTLCLAGLLQIRSIPLLIVPVFSIPVLICFGLRKHPLPFSLGLAIIFSACLYTFHLKGDVLYSERNFFGIKCVSVDSQRSLHILEHGYISHGYQRMYPQPSREPLAYYHRTGPIGDVFDAFTEVAPKRHVAVVGLGAGALASYAEPAQHFNFYEIDPSVKRLATDSRLFTYLEECRGDYDIILGDARIEITKASNGQFGIIVLDAFNSGSIPTHLITQEAVELYSSKLKDDGVIVCHISNRYLDLAPMLAKLAEELGMVCLSRKDSDLRTEDLQSGKLASCYLVMARSERDIGKLAQDPRWLRVDPPPNTIVWTDNYSHILNLLRW